MSSVLQVTSPLAAPDMAVLRRRTIFDCCKWDPQVGDTAVLADFALTLAPSIWQDLAAMAEALYRETLDAESEIAHRPDLLRLLRLPRAVRSALAAAAPGASDAGPPDAALRVMRFDFHPTTDGWAVSEVNSDVPGGYIEASGFTALMAAGHPGYAPCGDPVDALAAVLRTRFSSAGPVGLVHATAYSDDRQVMAFLERRFLAAGIESRLLAPDDLHWEDGQASARGERVGALLRFFPVEWLPNLARRHWRPWFQPTLTPQLNPGLAAISQSKRFPLTWPHLHTPPTVWPAVSPETRPWTEQLGGDWVSKPAFGRVGDGIGLAGVTTEREWKDIRRSRRRRPKDWIAQRRFTSQPVGATAGLMHACLGVYVVAGRAAGIYGRIAPRPLIDHHARDVAVLLRPDAERQSA